MTTMQKNELGAGLVLINKKTLLSKIPVSDRTIDAMEKEGAFPKRIALNSRNVVWVLDEVDAWIAKRRSSGAKARRPGITPGEKSSHPPCQTSPAA